MSYSLALAALVLRWIDHSLVLRPFEEEEKGPAGYEAMIDHRCHTVTIIRRRKARAAVLKVQIIKIYRVASCCQQ